MNREGTIARLKEAQKLPHATLEDFNSIPKGISEDELSKYLEDYLKPDGNCWLCESKLFLEWGITHGLANCTTCGMDVRVYHYLKNEEGKDVRIERSLQNHPKHYGVQEE